MHKLLPKKSEAQNIGRFVFYHFIVYKYKTNF